MAAYFPTPNTKQWTPMVDRCRRGPKDSYTLPPTLSGLCPAIIARALTAAILARFASAAFGIMFGHC
jgi:hypothetical protein